MWHTEEGDRTLSEPEWALFSTGIALLWASIEDDIRYETDDTEMGVPIFDRLTPEQKLALVADIADALRDPVAPSPHHTAANEGAIAAVFSMIRVSLETELGIEGANGIDEKPTRIRRMLRAVGEEPEDREWQVPDETATDADEWDWLVEEFEGRIFWDADFEMGDEFLDLPPEEARAKLLLLGIDPDYYLTLPDEPDKRGLIATRQTLARLLGVPVPDEDSQV
jgi:hypothetical protein